MLRDKACKIVDSYILKAKYFFGIEHNNTFDKKQFIFNKYSINQIMFLIGIYNLEKLLDQIISFRELHNYYKQLNLYYYCMLGAIYADNELMISKLEKLGLDVEIYRSIFTKNRYEFKKFLIECENNEN